MPTGQYCPIGHGPPMAGLSTVDQGNNCYGGFVKLCKGCPEARTEVCISNIRHCCLSAVKTQD